MSGTVDLQPENQVVTYTQGQEFTAYIQIWDKKENLYTDYPKTRIVITAGAPDPAEPSHLTIDSIVYGKTGLNAFDDLYGRAWYDDDLVIIVSEKDNPDIAKDDLNKAIGIDVDSGLYDGIKPDKINTEALFDIMPPPNDPRWTATSVALGKDARSESSSFDGIAIGDGAGKQDQNFHSIAIGRSSGSTKLKARQQLQLVIGLAKLDKATDLLLLVLMLVNPTKARNQLRSALLLVHLIRTVTV